MTFSDVFHKTSVKGCLSILNLTYFLGRVKIEIITDELQFEAREDDDWPVQWWSDGSNGGGAAA